MRFGPRRAPALPRGPLERAIAGVKQAQPPLILRGAACATLLNGARCPRRANESRARDGRLTSPAAPERPFDVPIMHLPAAEMLDHHARKLGRAQSPNRKLHMCASPRAQIWGHSLASVWVRRVTHRAHFAGPKLVPYNGASFGTARVQETMSKS